MRFSVWKVRKKEKNFCIYTKFYDSKEKASSYDSFGKTANEAIETALDFINDRKFKSLWKKLNG